MDRFFSLMCILTFAAQFSHLSAQTMEVWKDGKVITTLAANDVDSVTFNTEGEGSSTVETNPAITFSLKSSAPMMRAARTSSDDAEEINREFIVWGEKSESDASTKADNVVFDNYRVQYINNATGSIGFGGGEWDYVGITPYTDNVFPRTSDATQTVKRWDLGKTHTFTAVSASNSDINTGRVKFTKNFANTSKTTHGYTIELSKGADASAIYVADRKEVQNDNASVSSVEMKFGCIQSKIRFGFYETVPGYNVQITGVKFNNAQTASTTFGVDGDFIQVPTSSDGKLLCVVNYDSNNEPVLTIDRQSPTTTTCQTFGDKIFNTNIGASSNDATYDSASNAFTAIIANTNNETAMSFTIDYKLVAQDTGETIVVKDCQVIIPASYCQWKPNHAYTYLFKIFEAGLYPIALDAVTVEYDGYSATTTGLATK